MYLNTRHDGRRNSRVFPLAFQPRGRERARENRGGIERVRLLGHFGDCESVGEGVGELRVHFGSGYRVYLSRRGGDVVVPLAGGDKGSQARGIHVAQALAKEI